MASLVLGVAGAGLGGSLLGSGFSILGATITGAQIGGALGSLAGDLIDRAIAPGAQAKNGSRLSDVNLQGSTEGAAIPRLYGRVRVAGQLIWASRFKESVVKQNAGGGKGMGGSSAGATGYAYSISFAVGLCAGATSVGRVWAEGALLDLSQITMRFYSGSPSQPPDPLIAAVEGAENAPAFRDLAYVVFEDVPLAQFGNRIPQLQFEIMHAIGTTNPSSLEALLSGVALIPGAGEFVYDSGIVAADDGEGTASTENAHNAAGTADIDVSLDALQATAPNAKAVSLVAGWFGTDLRCGSCLVKPGVERAVKKTYPESWSVNGLDRVHARTVSQIDGRPAFGGTPSDASIVSAIRNLKARGLRVTFYPFLFMDVAAGNTLTDPLTGNKGQAPYPWRGRITCSPAPGVAGSPDQTSAAAPQVNAFFGRAKASDFAVSGTTVRWTGGEEWSWRRMVLHYAHLCAAAGGVDAFLIGSELVGITRVRDGATSYPAVTALRALAADVRTILGTGTKIGYGADWSEYNNHQTGNGSVIFNLDPLWDDPNIDFVGIDNYMPLADWRDGSPNADADVASSIYDSAYLRANIRGGEDYDWFYASHADRDAQTRTPISDGLGKPWVWRAKDLWNWWSNPHFDRPQGTESETPTAWVPCAKPIWLTELGCPAVDKGANQPNVFVDPKSAESALPYYSNGARDDLMQRRFLEAHFAFWTDDANNPQSPVYAGRMVDTANIYVWCWDARPFPYFPALTDLWGDAANYANGDWLNGRVGAVDLAGVVRSICADSGFTAIDTSTLAGLLTGFAVTDTMSARDALTPLSVAYQFDAVESEGLIRFVPRGQSPAPLLTADDLVLPDDAPSASFVRAQETDLPNVSRIAYIDAADYRQASADARRMVTLSERVASSSLPIVMDQAVAIGIGQRLLQDAWVMRETAAFALPPSHLARDVTDEVTLALDGRAHRLRLTAIDDGAARVVQAVATDPSIYETVTGPVRAGGAITAPAQPGRPAIVFLDLPLLTGSEVPWAPHVAAFASPWPGSELVFRSAGDANFMLDTTIGFAATMGRLTADLGAGPVWCWDEGNALSISLSGGTLASLDDLSVLGGANAIAVQNARGEWEVIQFAQAVLMAPGQWTLTRLLRGQGGTEAAMGAVSGARVVLLDGALEQLALGQGEATLPFNYACGPPNRPLSDPSYQTQNLQGAAIGLRPLSPVQLTTVRQGNGDLLLSWIRRTRIGGDDWEQIEVPLGEDAEAYAVDILNGATVVRTLQAAQPSVLYTAAMAAADFPSGLPEPFHFTVAQISAAFGRGAATSA